MTDGSLDYPDEVMATLDYAVVSVHQNFTLSEKAQTERIVRAVHNPYAKILGHLTGRLVLRRPGYAVDQDCGYRGVRRDRHRHRDQRQSRTGWTWTGAGSSKPRSAAASFPSTPTRTTPTALTTCTTAC